jgi:hypothetical protein
VSTLGPIHLARPRADEERQDSRPRWQYLESELDLLVAPPVPHRYLLHHVLGYVPVLTKSWREAIRALKRLLVRPVFRLLVEGSASQLEAGLTDKSLNIVPNRTWSVGPRCTTCPRPPRLDPAGEGYSYGKSVPGTGPINRGSIRKTGAGIYLIGTTATVADAPRLLLTVMA